MTTTMKMSLISYIFSITFFLIIMIINKNALSKKVIHSMLAYVKFACTDNLVQTIEKQIGLQSVHIVTLYYSAPYRDNTSYLVIMKQSSAFDLGGTFYFCFLELSCCCHHVGFTWVQLWQGRQGSRGPGGHPPRPVTHTQELDIYTHTDLSSRHESLDSKGDIHHTIPLCRHGNSGLMTIWKTITLLYRYMKSE